MLKKVFGFIAILFTFILLSAPPQAIIAMTPAETVVTPGTVVRFSGKITNGDQIPGNARVFYEEYVDGIRKRMGHIALDEEITLERTMRDPGWYMVRLRLVDENNRDIHIGGKPVSGGRGVMIDPQNIPASSARPADFDEFWNSRRALLDTVPIRELERREVGNDPQSRLAVYDVKVSCPGSRPVSGILTMPRNAPDRSLPAFVFFQGAGVSTAVSYGGFGPHAMTFMVNAHGIDNLRERSYYQELANGSLRNYAHFNKNDREKIYFHDMFLRVMRALEYVKSLPQWNGQILIVRGGSQGGAQAIVAAAMDPQVTLLIAEVPAMSDHNGFKHRIPRRCGWPTFYGFDASDQDVVRTASYYDMVNFASRIRCEAYITTGLTDLVCPPNGVACVFNVLVSENKHFLIHPTGDHAGAQLDRAFLQNVINRLTAHLKESDNN